MGYVLARRRTGGARRVPARWTALLLATLVADMAPLRAQEGIPGTLENPYRMHAGLERPVLLEDSTPEYTDLARKARLQGVVIVETVVDREGRVHEVEVLKGLPMGLSEKAVEAVRRRRFRPATLDGEPVAVHYNQTVNFQLDDAGVAFQPPVRVGETYTTSTVPTLRDGFPIPGDPAPGWRMLLGGVASVLFGLLWMLVMAVAGLIATVLLLRLGSVLGLPSAVGRFGAEVVEGFRARNGPADE